MHIVMQRRKVIIKDMWLLAIDNVLCNSHSLGKSYSESAIKGDDTSNEMTDSD